MGSGKSAIGRRIARALKMGFVDIDQQVVDRGDQHCRDFEIAGEAKFREMERAAIAKRLSVSKNYRHWWWRILSARQRRTMLKSSHVIWLKATPETLVARIGNTKSRPLLHVDDPLGTLIKLLDERTQFYQQAQIHIDTDGMTSQRAVRAILESLDTFLGKH